MTDETIVAVYETADRADAAIRDLKAAGITDSAISRHAGGASTTSTTTATAPVREEGFWSRLFGADPADEGTIYDRSLDTGSTVVTVKVTDGNAERVMDILDQHAPIDLDDRAATYGIARSEAPLPVADYAATTATTATSGETLQLAEERLSVGKRLVNLGGTRIRRFVVETPVEEQVTLHSERVVMDRRPVADGRAVAADAFTEKTIEMTESAEEAVVAKTTVVTEEIGLHKDVADRVETVRDTVRREDVEIEKIAGVTNRAA